MAKTKLDYNKVAKNIIANIGGKENVTVDWYSINLNGSFVTL